jgi:hypothetical protein
VTIQFIPGERIRQITRTKQLVQRPSVVLQRELLELLFECAHAVVRSKKYQNGACWARPIDDYMLYMRKKTIHLVIHGW